MWMRNRCDLMTEEAFWRLYTTMEVLGVQTQLAISQYYYYATTIGLIIRLYMKDLGYYVILILCSIMNYFMSDYSIAVLVTSMQVV